ncbi:glycosyltransferase family 2 protein [Deminuibacter soli]|uniref:Glycosyltransferase family 2 protein n=1 Tax=Deminuibacter soli TaxID=2291815 RepID=A0A3E1NKW1_9BACT|nr:glycosyltransferase family 2 protein [Deminuibacter soli]RFM28566.1 glycosyltransferase family 2 protein [Deminuibacter soli]
MTDSSPEVAIVILNYNGKKFLERFLPHVLASTYGNKRVIVADNASADDSVAFVRAQHPGVELILLPENYGFAGGYNKALQQVQSDYYVLLNSDVEVTPGWIEPVIEWLQLHPQYVVGQPKILAWNEKDHFEYAGAAGGWIDYLGYPFARGRVFTTLEADNNQYNNNVPVFWASGAAMFIKAAVYHEVGGLDEYFFAHQEEIDLCWRIQLAGYKVACCPASVVYHVGGGTLPKGHRKTLLNFRNNLVMLLKNLPANEQRWKIPLRIALDHVFALKCIAAGDIESYKAIWQAHRAVREWKRTHRPQQAAALLPMAKLDGVLQASLVIAYFLKGKKRFTEIISQENNT